MNENEKNPSEKLNEAMAYLRQLPEFKVFREEYLRPMREDSFDALNHVLHYGNKQVESNTVGYVAAVNDILKFCQD